MISADRLYVALEGSKALLFGVAWTINQVFLAVVVGLDPLQLVLVGTTLELTLLLAEVPTGIVADSYSRRTSVLIGLALFGAGLVIEGWWTTFAGALLGNVVLALAWAFSSGATSAWMVDETDDSRAAVAFTHATRAGLAGGLVGALLAGSIGSISLQAPILAAGFGFWVVTAAAAVTMREDGFRPAVHETFAERWQAMLGSLRTGVAIAARRPVVRGLLVVTVITGLASEAFDRLWTPHLLSFGVPSWVPGGSTASYFAGIQVVGTLVALAASWAAQRLAPSQLANEHPRLPFAVSMLALSAASLLVAGAAGPWWVLAGVWLRGAALAVAEPLEAAWLNRHTPSPVRATVLSLLGQGRAAGELAGGPPLGAVASRWGIAWAMVASAVIQAPTVAVIAGLRPRGDHYDDPRD